MIHEKALRLAGPGAVLCYRPTSDVRHVYVGPLTPSGRYVPRSGRTVCRAHTRRLTVLSGNRTPSLCAHGRTLGRVCARCSAHLARRVPSTATPVTRGVQVGRALPSREDWARAYAGMTMADVAVQLLLAESPAEVDAVAHASLVLFGVAACMQPFTDYRTGRRWPSLQKLTHQSRAHVGGFDHTFGARLSDQAKAHSVMVREQRARERQEVRRQREDRIVRLGINNAVPNPPPRRRRTT